MPDPHGGKGIDSEWDMVRYNGARAAGSIFFGECELCNDLQKLPDRSERTNLFENIAISITKATVSRLGPLVWQNTTFFPDVVAGYADDIESE